MKLGVHAGLYNGGSLEATLDYIKGLGISNITMACGGYESKALLDPARLLQSKIHFFRFRESLNTYDIELDALSCIGDPLNADPELAKAHDADIKNAILISELLESDTLTVGSGLAALPEGQDDIRVWEDAVLPYWYGICRYAEEHGITRLAFRISHGDSVNSTKKLLMLREALGDTVGASLDPSRLLLAGIDPALACSELAGAIYHVAACDIRLKGSTLPAKPYPFCTVGYGMGADAWRNIIYSLAEVGYEGNISVEQRDRVIPPTEGIFKAISFLKPIVIDGSDE